MNKLDLSFHHHLQLAGQMAILVLLLNKTDKILLQNPPSCTSRPKRDSTCPSWWVNFKKASKQKIHALCVPLHIMVGGGQMTEPYVTLSNGAERLASESIDPNHREKGLTVFWRKE